MATKTPKKIPRPVGQPPKEINWQTLDAILQYGAQLIDACEILGVSEDCIQDQIKKKYQCTFSEYRNSKMSKTRLKLRQKQIEQALNGNTQLLIWLGKQMLDQHDRVEQIQPEQIKIELANLDALDL